MAGLSVGNSCIEKELRPLMAEFAAKDPAFLMKFIDNLIPDCVAAPAAAVKAASARIMPPHWLAKGGKMIYMDAQCKEQEFTSPSAFMAAVGIKTSGMQCLEDGSSCRVESQMDTIRRHGYTVRSDVELPKQAPKDSTIMLITAIHPDCVASMAAEKKASKRVTAGGVTTRKATPEELAGLKG